MGPLLILLACTLHGHCEGNGATKNGLAVSCCMSKVRGTIYSERGTSCCRHANFFPCWGRLGMLNPGTSTELCGTSCRSSPVPSASSWQPRSDTAWSASPGLQGCHACSEIGGWAATRTGHTGVPFAHSLLLPDCNLASTDCLQCSNNCLKLWSYTTVFRRSVLWKSTLSPPCFNRKSQGVIVFDGTSGWFNTGCSKTHQAFLQRTNWLCLKNTECATQYVIFLSNF